MSIAIFDKFKNFIPVTTIFDGPDVSMVILVDPPAEVPKPLLAGKGVLDTASKKIKIYGEDGETVVHDFDISDTDLKPINDAISALDGRVSTLEGDNTQNKADISAIKLDIGTLQNGVSDNAEDIASNASDISALQGSIGDQNGEINAIKITLGQVETTANNADALSKTNAGKLENALLKDEYGWDVNNLNVYNVSRLSRTNNAVNSSGVSIGDADVNLHGDTVGITSGNSGTTYAVFTSGGLNLNDFPLTRMGSGGDNDTNAANIGDVKRIATDGSGLKPTGEEWDMLGYPVTNIGTSEVETSASTVGQVNAVKSTADAADTLSKDNAQRLDNLPPAPDLDGYVKNGEDVNFGTAEINIVKVTKGDDKTKFSDILIDGNTNTEMNFVGDTHFYIRDKADNSKGLEAFQIDSSARFVAKQKVKTPIITNLGSGTTNSNSDKAAFIDLSVENEVKLGAKSKIDFNVAGNGIIEVAAAGLKFLRDVDANNHNLTKIKHLVGNSAGSMNVANVHIVKRDDSSDTSQSIQFNTGDLTAFSDKHEWKTNDNARRLTIENHEANWHDCILSNVKDAVSDKDATNLAQVNALIAASGGGSLQEWFEVARGNLASTGDRPTGGSSDSNINVWHASVAESTTNPLNELKTLHEGAYAEVSAWDKPLRYKLAQGDKEQYWEVESNGWGTDGDKVWHLSARKVTGDDLSIGDNTVVYASPFFDGNDGSIEFKKVKSNVTGSPTYYYHNGDNHLYIEYTGNGGTIALDTMRSGADDQVEDMTAVHNTTDTECSIRLFFNGSSTVHAIPAHSFLHGWANRDIGKWVIVTSKDPAYTISEHLIVKSTDLSWSTSSDPRTNTQRMISAAPPVCTIIGRHASNGNAKEKIVSVGDSNRLESQVSIFVVNKQASGHATGICSSEESNGKTWSRILDGNRGAWFTNDTANSRMASSDIDPSLYPEEQIFFTTDKGIMETYVDESEEGDVGVIKLREINGYNVPKNEADIAALEIQTEKNRSVTHYFVNEGELSYDWPDEERRPLVEVQVLNTTQTINNSSVTVTDNDEHKYGGEYNTVGSLAINTSGNWTNQYVYHNAYKHESESYYVVFNQGNLSWQIIESANPHTSIGEHAAAVSVQLGGQSSLPASFGNYVIDPNFDDIDSLEFFPAEVPTQYDDVNSRVIIKFNGAKPSGFVTLK